MSGFGFGFRQRGSRRSIFPFGQAIPPLLAPSAAWTGTAASGFSAVPADPVRVTAKPVCRLLVTERQTVTDTLMVGVFAAANNNGSLLQNLGLQHVRFHLEGETVTVAAPSLQMFVRPDGSTYRLWGWWVTLARPPEKNGPANLYVEAVPADPAMQSRITGPHRFLLYGNRHDFDIEVAATPPEVVGVRYRTLASALAYLRGQNADRPRVRMTEPGTYAIGSAGGNSNGSGYCTIEATVPVTFSQSPPASQAEFTRFRPNYDRLHFKGDNITIDFAQALEFYTEIDGQWHWLDGCRITNSLGRTQLWRRRPRTLVAGLFRFGAYFTDCTITSVENACDKAVLARGNRITGTWADLFDDALCIVANRVVDHSSFWYYQNVDALRIRYTGPAAAATVSLSGSNLASSRVMTLRQDGTTVATFTIDNTAPGFTANTNYTVQNVANWINTIPGWTATLLDNSRLAAALTSPGSTNGGSFTNLNAKNTDLTLPTHFDLHSDIYQLPVLGVVRENVVMAFNRGTAIDAQNIFVGGAPIGIADAAFIGNAFYNRLGTADEALASQLGGTNAHVIVAHNSMPTQRLLLRQDIAFNGDRYCLIANNAMREISVAGGTTPDPDVTIKGNHVDALTLAGFAATIPGGATSHSIGGNSVTNFVNAIEGDFTPAGSLRANPKVPVITLDIDWTQRGSTASAGASAP